MKGVLMHKPSSVYDDDPATRYHFPAQYKTITDELVGDWILYYEPGSHARHYKAVARIADIIDDPVPRDKRHYYARMEPGSYRAFEAPVPARDANASHRNSLIELAEPGRKSFLTRRSVRKIPDDDFDRIVKLGLATALDITTDNSSPSQTGAFGLEEPDAVFEGAKSRLVVQALITQSVRDRAFRAAVISAYEKRCALTGLSLQSATGSSEVQAAHIRPVASGGSDSVRNGIALCATAHWMFDKGLVTFGDQMSVRLSSSLIIPDGLRNWLSAQMWTVPEDANLSPHPEMMSWHAAHVFQT